MPLPKNKKTINIWIKIFQIIDKQNQKKIALLLVIIFFTSCLEVLSIGLVYPFIKLITEENGLILEYSKSFFSNAYSFEKIIIISSILFIVFYILKTIIITLLIVFNNKFAFSIFSQTSVKLFNNILIDSKNDHKKNKSALLNLLINETQNFTKIMIFELSRIIEILTIIFIFSFLFYLNPVICIVMISIFSILIAFIYILNKKKLKNLGKSRLSQAESLYTFVNDSLNFLDEIKIYSKVNEFKNFYSNQLYNFSNILRDQNILISIPRYFIDLIFVLTVVLIVLVSILLNLNSNEMLAIIGVYAAAGLRLLPGLNRLLQIEQNLKLLYPVLDKIYAYNKEFNINNKNTRKNIIIKNNIELQNVSIGFKGNTILNEINLSIKKNQIVGIFGKSGSGKSSLIKTIIGLIDPIKGKILLDKKIVSNNYLIKAAYVSQDNYIINNTLKSNISLNLTNSNTNTRVKKLLKDFNLSEFKVNKFLNENGSNLSEGQKQRISLARSFYEDYSVLIFDEPTSSLDFNNKNKVIKNLKKTSKDKLLIIISHDESIKNLCNDIYIIKNKKIVKEK